MVWAAALTLLAGSTNVFIEAAKVIPNNAEWRFITEGESFYWVNPDEIDRGDLAFGTVTVWLHGWHSRDKDVPYRSSIWRVRLDCKGSLTYQAATTYRADGSTDKSWDGLGTFEYVRPNSMQAYLEKAMCKK